MAGTRAPFASLAALALAASAQAGEQTGVTATEAAKKDLQSLPTVQRPLDATTNKSLFPSGAVPELSLGTPAANGTPAKNRDEAASGRSLNWLLDGVNQLESEAKAQREAAEKNKSDDTRASTPSGERQSNAGTANPFSEYLTQWISPADQSLLNAGKQNAASSSASPWEAPRTDFGREANLSAQGQNAANPFQVEQSGLPNSSANRTAQNPYLAESFELEAATRTALNGSSDRSEATTGVPAILSPAQTFPSSAPVAAPIEQARPAPAAPPTERLIDDRKYFPQLRRF